MGFYNKKAIKETKTHEKLLLFAAYFCDRAVLLLFLFGWHHIGGMAFTLVGLPILYYILRSTSVFVQYERSQAKVYTDISIDPISSRTRAEEGLWEQVKVDLLDASNWKVIFLLLKFVIGLVSIICATLFYVAPLIFLLASILYPLDFLNFVGLKSKRSVPYSSSCLQVQHLYGSFLI
nr:sensor domain-containing protein [Paenibacillus glacialis]